MPEIKINEVSEAQAILYYIKRGYSVSVPFCGPKKYDFLAEIGPIMLRVQVKTGRLVARKTGNPRRIGFSAAYGSRAKKPYVGYADVFAVYCPETDQVYILPVDKRKKRYITL